MKDFLKKTITSILIWQSKYILKKYKPIVISITGSVGKTSTKDAIFTALSSTFYVRKSEKSFNGEIGIPLTILGCPNGWSDPFVWIGNILKGFELMLFNSDYPKYLIIEVGADHPGDIRTVSKWLKSDVVVINKISDIPVHVEFFKSAEEVLNEKSSLIETLRNNGTLVLYGDDEKVVNLAKKFVGNVMTFAIENIATVNASNISVNYDENKDPAGMSFKVNIKGNSIPIKIQGVLGNQNVYPILAAITVGTIYSISPIKMIDAFDEHVKSKGRMNIIKGMNNSIIIDDSYNSSPDALREGLTTLATLQVSGRRIAVIGDMMELGNFSIDEHKKAGILALQSCDMLITVGHRSRLIGEQSTNSVQISRFNTSNEAGEYLKNIISLGDVVYVKGSQSIRMERVVKAIMSEPERSHELLVRQEEEWLAKS